MLTLRCVCTHAALLLPCLSISLHLLSDSLALYLHTCDTTRISDCIDGRLSIIVVVGRQRVHATPHHSRSSLASCTARRSRRFRRASSSPPRRSRSLRSSFCACSVRTSLSACVNASAQGLRGEATRSSADAPASARTSARTFRQSSRRTRRRPRIHEYQVSRPWRPADRPHVARRARPRSFTPSVFGHKLLTSSRIPSAHYP